MMDNLTTLARPYAVAAFEYALSQDILMPWQLFLQKAAEMAKQKDILKWLTHPFITKSQLLGLFEELLQPYLINLQQNNFLKILAENKRLILFPAIANLFAELKAQHEKIVDVNIISAVPLQENYQQKIAASLTKRLQRQIELTYEVDPSLLGGAIIRAGDLVIDGSVRGKLNRLLDSL